MGLDDEGFVEKGIHKKHREEIGVYE